MFLEFQPHFQTMHRTPDFDTYDEAGRDFKRLASNGQIEGDRCRVHIGERAPQYDGVFVTVWRTVKVAIESEWESAIDGGEELLCYRYTRRFDPVATTPAEVVAATREVLLARRISN